MKRVLIITGSILGLLLLVMAVAPVFFKDDIKKGIDKVIAESVDADIIWEADDFSLSFFSSFPNLEAKLENIGVVNRAPFEGEILFVSDAIEVEIDLFSLFGDQVRIVGIGLENPVFNVLVDSEGNANYDIAVENPGQVDEVDSASELNVGINEWRISNGTINYSDATVPIQAVLRHVEHTGSGEFSSDEFDLQTHTAADSVSVAMDGTSYLSNKSVDIDAIISVSDNFSTFSFKENTITVNAFTVGIDGVLKMLDERYEMDLTANAKDNSFKSLLSLVPGIYSDEFDRIKANGTLDFMARLNGSYSEETIPAFELNLRTANSMFQYPDLPSPVSNISLDLTVSNKDGILENTSISIPVFHAELGKNPIDATLEIANLNDYEMKGSLAASLNFADITAIFPVEGMEIRGNGSADLTFEGTYDSARSLMPTIKGKVHVGNTFIKSSELPYALEKVNLTSEISSPTGYMKDFKMNISPFSMQLDGAPFMAEGEISNLDNYTWNLKAQGSVDLNKLVSVLKLEDLKLQGQLMADVHSRGNMAALNAERYNELPTSGDVTLRNFSYESPDISQPFKISEASLTFDPAKMNLVRFESTYGSSDFSIKGAVSNYMGYVLDKNAILKGNLNIISRKVDLNEFMVAEQTDPVNTDSTISVIQVPDHIEFIVNAEADEVDLTNMQMKNAKGRLVVSNQVLTLESFTFDMLGGSFSSQGSYNTSVADAPAFDFSLDISEVKMEDAFQTFEMVRRFAPVAGQVNGMVSTEIQLSGLLEQDMSPKLNSINANGLVNIMHATLKNSKILQEISAVSSLDTGGDLTFEDLILNIDIEDGRLHVDPFKVNIRGYETEIMGSTSLDGSIAYEFTTMVPAGQAGEKLNNFLAQNVSDAQTQGDMIPVTIGIGGTYNAPEAALLMDDQKEMLEQALRQRVSEEAGEKAGELLKNVDDEQTKKILGDVLGINKKDSVAADSASMQKENPVKEEAVDKIKDFFNRKKKKSDSPADTTSTGSI